MLKNIIPNELFVKLKNLNLNNIYEIRMRANKPLVVNYKNTFITLKDEHGKEYICTKQMLNSVIFKASNQSLYASNEEIKKGFIAVKGGIRIGITGECVLHEDRVKTIKNFSSLNIRIPHEVRGCSLKTLKYLIEGSSVYNTLVLSPPGAGKTTYLRDLACQLSDELKNINILMLDERYELASSQGGSAQLDVGKFTDIMSGTTKQFGFENGIRSMSPQIIITDEIATYEDVKSIMYAKGCGVRVIASMHGYTEEDLVEKPHFNELIKNKIFSRYVVLSSREGAGTIEKVLDENLINLLKE